MDNIRLINIKEAILSENQDLANEIRERLAREKVYMLNVMSSPGSGKTSVIVETIRRLKGAHRIAVIEADIESLVDAEKIAREGVAAVQLHTDGACHLDAPMVQAALETLDLRDLDLIFLENIGNLVCPAEFDTGATRKAMILSVPEGDDKVLKYPLMFSVCDVLIVNKTDYLELTDFDMKTLKERVGRLNPAMKIFEISCKTGQGVKEWCDWLEADMKKI